MVEGLPAFFMQISTINDAPEAGGRFSANLIVNDRWECPDNREKNRSLRSRNDRQEVKVDSISNPSVLKKQNVFMDQGPEKPAGCFPAL